MTSVQQAVPQDAEGRPRILCVDDEPHVLEGLRNNLRRQFDVRTAVSGADGLRCLGEQGPFTVVMSDFVMPGINGAEFLAQARMTAPETVRILLTGQATLGNTLAAVNAGNIFRLLLKPCAPADLVLALDDAIEQARLLTADRALLQRQLDAMCSHLVRAERLASLGTMAGAVGHELNNLLMVFRGAREALEEAVAAGVTPSPHSLETLGKVEEHLTLHARNLLSLGRPAPVEAAPETDLRDVVSDVISGLSRAGILRRVHVQLEMPPQRRVVRVSRVEIEQILINLVKNAVETLEDDPPASPSLRISIGSPSASGTVTCSVSDNGAGIPAARLPLLFEPYYTTKAPYRGTGLGLFVVKQIAHSAGGDVLVQSEPRRSTTFTVILPLARQKSNGHAKQAVQI